MDEVKTLEDLLARNKRKRELQKELYEIELAEAQEHMQWKQMVVRLGAVIVDCDSDYDGPY